MFNEIPDKQRSNIISFGRHPRTEKELEHKVFKIKTIRDSFKLNLHLKRLKHEKLLIKWLNRPDPNGIFMQ